MFFEYVKSEMKKSRVKIGLPPVGHGDMVTILPEKIIPGVASWFLTEDEKQRLAEIAKKDAQGFKVEQEKEV